MRLHIQIQVSMILQNTAIMKRRAGSAGIAHLKAVVPLFVRRSVIVEDTGAVAAFGVVEQYPRTKLGRSEIRDALERHTETQTRIEGYWDRAACIPAASPRSPRRTSSNEILGGLSREI